MRLAYKLRFVPMLTGFIFVFGSFSNWGAASIPYQDPTPELYQHYLNEVRTAQLWLVLSIIFFLIGLVYFFVIKNKY